MLGKLKEIQQYKELLYYFAWRDLKVRYKQTFLGAFWVVLQPVALMLIFVVFLSQFGRISDTGVVYAVYLYSGLIFANYYTTIINTVSNSVTGNAGIIKKIYFPRSIPGIAQVLVASVDFFVRLVFFFLLIAFYRVDIHFVGILALPILMLAVVAFSLGFGLLFAALNVKYRDVGQALPLVNQMIFYLTPIIYSFEIVPENLRNLLALNPLVGIVITSRDLLFEGSATSPLYLLSGTIVSLCFVILGFKYFIKQEPTFVDTV